MKATIDVKLYDNDLSSPTFIRHLTEEIENLQLSTILHGGFGICSFNLACDLRTAWIWRTKYWYYRLVVLDHTKTLFEGRLEDIEFIDSGLTATFFGFYSACGDQPYLTAYSTTADEIIKAILTASCPDINADQTNIEATDITIDDIEANEDLYLVDLASRLADYSDSSNQTWFFAIWEDRIPYFFPRVMTAVDWWVSMSEVEGLGLRASVKDLWNSVYAEYTIADARNRTGTVTDSDSIVRYGITRTKGILGLGEVTAAAAQAQRDGFLENQKDAQQHTDRFVIGGSVRNTSGLLVPSSHIRAGEVIRIQDLVPASADLGSLVLDSLRTFYIKETQYDADRARVTIIPDTESQSLAATLARDYSTKSER